MKDFKNAFEKPAFFELKGGNTVKNILILDCTVEQTHLFKHCLSSIKADTKRKRNCCNIPDLLANLFDGFQIKA